MLIRIHPQNPEKRILQQLLDGLSRGSLYILPTDTVYAFCALLSSPRAINEIYRIKRMKEGAPLSLLCRDLAMASQYAQSIPQPLFRFIKAHTPGPYTFILHANRQVDRRGVGKRKEVGIRFVDHPLHRALMEQLDVPLVSSSIIQSDEFMTDPEELERIYGAQVEAVVDGGVRTHEFSTVLDCSDGEIRLVRAGAGDVTDLDGILVGSAQEDHGRTL